MRKNNYHMSALNAMLLCVVILFSFSSCEKEITVDIPRADQKLVVEGYVENGELPYVILTKTYPYFDPVDSTALVGLLVLDAKVYISDGTQTDTLSLTFDSSIFPPLFYRSNTMTGEIGKTYNLTIEYDGKVYTSSTRIPPAISLDSLWFKIQPGKDSLGFVWAHLTDPDSLGNAYRWSAKRIGKDDNFVAPMGSVFEDKFVNGKSFDFAYNRGEKPNSEAIDDNNEERFHFKRGDTLIIKFSSIDRTTFDIWRSIETDISNNGNPFAAPSSVRTNIKGGAIGIWAGYGNSFHGLKAAE